jgi:ABC-type molybdate transport system ATPase subunit
MSGFTAMIEIRANENEPIEGFQLFFENQNVSNLATRCYVSENPNEVCKGWVELFIRNSVKLDNGKESYGHLMQTTFDENNPKYEMISIRLDGYLHWSDCKDYSQKNMNNAYFESMEIPVHENH